MPFNSKQIMDKEQDNNDQSMEEILQSIKRIIADDDTIEDDSNETSGDDMAGSDILELKDIVKPASMDEQMTNGDALSALLDSEPRPQAKAPEPQTPPAQDFLSDIDSLLNPQTAQASSSALQQLKTMGQKAEKNQVADTQPLSLRSGTTIEDLVVEALKPELKAWLNAHLPHIVERLVQAEIKKISQ